MKSQTGFMGRLLGMSVLNLALTCCGTLYEDVCPYTPSNYSDCIPIYCSPGCYVGEDRSSLVIDGSFYSEGMSVNAVAARYFHKFWGRKIRLRLPRGFKDIYMDGELAVIYPDNTVVWAAVVSGLRPGETELGIGRAYCDGVYSVSTGYIDSLIYQARLKGTTMMRMYGDPMETVLMRQGKIFSGGKPGYTFTGPKPPLFYLSPAMKERRAILHVKDGVFVLAYNIKERDYPLFEAYIRDTFVVCSRYMDIVDAETLEYERRGASPNVVRSQYMEERFYREIPTVTPPDSAQIVEDAWRGTGLTPDLFRNR